MGYGQKITISLPAKFEFIMGQLPKLVKNVILLEITEKMTNWSVGEH
jgi:hypothetical protein